MTPDRTGALARPTPSGRVLRVKSGYNPNSSSIGTALPTFVVLTAGAGALAAMLLHLTGTVAALLRGKPPESAQATAAASTDGDVDHEPRTPE